MLFLGYSNDKSCEVLWSQFPAAGFELIPQLEPNKKNICGTDCGCRSRRWLIYLMWNFLGMKDLCLAKFVRRWKEGKVVSFLFAQEKGNFLRNDSHSKTWKISDLQVDVKAEFFFWKITQTQSDQWNLPEAWNTNSNHIMRPQCEMLGIDMAAGTQQTSRWQSCGSNGNADLQVLGNKKFLVQTDKFLFQRVSILQKTLASDFVTDISSTLVWFGMLEPIKPHIPPVISKSLPETWWPFPECAGLSLGVSLVAMWVMSLWLILCLISPPIFNIAPEKWWLEDYFPFGKIFFQGLC